jgi:hypothetical protein
MEGVALERTLELSALFGDWRQQIARTESQCLDIGCLLASDPQRQS